MRKREKGKKRCLPNLRVSECGGEGGEGQRVLGTHGGGCGRYTCAQPSPVPLGRARWRSSREEEGACERWGRQHCTRGVRGDGDVPGTAGVANGRGEASGASGAAKRECGVQVCVWSLVGKGFCASMEGSCERSAGRRRQRGLGMRLRGAGRGRGRARGGCAEGRGGWWQRVGVCGGWMVCAAAGRISARSSMGQLVDGGGVLVEGRRRDVGERETRREAGEKRLFGSRHRWDRKTLLWWKMIKGSLGSQGTQPERRGEDGEG